MKINKVLFDSTHIERQTLPYYYDLRQQDHSSPQEELMNESGIDDCAYEIDLGALLKSFVIFLDE
jgi:hypothetical protein